MNYTEFSNALQTLLTLTDDFGEAAFNALLPRIIEDAEGRIFNDLDLDFLWQRFTDISTKTEPYRRAVPIPAAMHIIETVNLVIPANTQPAAKASEDQQGSLPGRRIPLQRVDVSFIDSIWPIESQTQPPDPDADMYFGIYSQDAGKQLVLQDNTGATVKVPPDGAEPGDLASSLIIAPTTDGEYILEISGLGRPAPISADNPNTILATLYPELLLAAAMVFGCALLKNWSAMADDPRSALSWEQHYKDVKAVVSVDADRQKSQGPGLTPSGPAIYPPRPQLQPQPQPNA